MAHTYYTVPARWVIEGQFTRANGNPTKGIGVAVIRHADHLWINENEITLADGAILLNKFEVTPSEAPNLVPSSFRTAHPMYGLVTGQFVLANDTIVIVYSAENKIFSGFEFINQQNETGYQCHGYLFRDKHRILQWNVSLSREAGC